MKSVGEMGKCGWAKYIGTVGVNWESKLCKCCW